MAALSGKYGQALCGASSDIDELLSWELDYGAKTEVYASRDGAGAEQTVEGVFGGTGTIMVNFDPAKSFTSLAGTTGQLVQLNLYATKQSGVIQAYGQARLGKFKYGAKRSGEVQQISIPFTTHGLWALP